MVSDYTMTQWGIPSTIDNIAHLCKYLWQTLFWACSILHAVPKWSHLMKLYIMLTFLIHHDMVRYDMVLAHHSIVVWSQYSFDWVWYQEGNDGRNDKWCCVTVSVMMTSCMFTFLVIIVTLHISGSQGEPSNTPLLFISDIKGICYI